MPKFSLVSEERLAQVHPDLQLILREAIKVTDFSVLTGHRTEEEQEDCYARRTSKLRWPHSRHNSLPAEAVDVAPYPLNWSDTKAFHFLAGVILGIAHTHNVELTWGGHWQSFKDLPHFELKRKLVS